MSDTGVILVVCGGCETWTREETDRCPECSADYGAGHPRLVVTLEVRDGAAHVVQDLRGQWDADQIAAARRAAMRVIRGGGA